MRWRSWMCAVLAITLTVACGRADEPPREAAPAAHGDELLYHCADGFPFDPFRFEPGNEEEGTDGPSQGLVRVLGSVEGASLPSTGWTRVERHGKQIGFVARDNQGRFYDVRVEKQDGRWDFAGLGDCRPELAVGDASIVEWVLDPDKPALEPGAQVIHALIRERACHSFEDPLDRMNEPKVLYHPDKTYVVLTAEPLRGFHTCPGTPWVKFEIELDEPLPGGEVYDASLYPPRPADREPR